MDSIGGVQETQYRTGGPQGKPAANSQASFALLFSEMMSRKMDQALFSGLGASEEDKDSIFSDGSILSVLLQLAGGGSPGSLQAGGVSSANAVYGVANSSAAGITGKGAAEAALTRLGDPYSQAKRGSGNYVDCSSLTQWAYQKTGVSLPGTAAEQAKYCVQNGYTVSKQDLQAGDLVFWQKSGCNCGRYDEIHHVGIYLGDGKIVEASSSQGKVVVNDLWDGSGKWQVAFYARPY